MRWISTLPSRATSTLVAALTVAGCAGSPSALPQQSSVVAQTAKAAASASWMVPQATSAQTLLYVANPRDLAVNVFDYKDGVVGELYGQISQPNPNGMCSDKNGDVWITSYSDGVLEYPHGGTTPIGRVHGIKGEPLACAVDSDTGDVAVSVFHDDSNYGMLTSVRIFGKGRLGHNYSIQNGFGRIEYLTYDNNGNLFIDGSQCGQSECYGPDYYEPEIFELTKTGTEFAQLALHGATLVNPTGIEWVNPTLLLADSDYSYSQPVGYKVLVRGQTATVVATLPFRSSSSAGGLAVRGSSIVVPDPIGNTIDTYDLKTGKLQSTYDISEPDDVVISQK